MTKAQKPDVKMMDDGQSEPQLSSLNFNLESNFPGLLISCGTGGRMIRLINSSNASQ